MAGSILVKHGWRKTGMFYFDSRFSTSIAQFTASLGLASYCFSIGLFCGCFSCFTAGHVAWNKFTVSTNDRVGHSSHKLSQKLQSAAKVPPQIFPRLIHWAYTGTGLGPRTIFRGGPGGAWPRAPTSMGPTKVIIFLFVATCWCNKDVCGNGTRVENTIRTILFLK